MAWLTKINCKNCLEEHTLVTERGNMPRLGDSLIYVCPVDGKEYSIPDQGKSKCSWEKVLSVRVQTPNS